MNAGVIKAEVLKLIAALPEHVTVEDIMRELYFKIKIDNGLKELDEGKGIPHEEVEMRLSRWLSKDGGNRPHL